MWAATTHHQVYPDCLNERASWAPASPLSARCVCHVTGCLLLLRPHLHHHEWLHPQSCEPSWIPLLNGFCQVFDNSNQISNYYPDWGSLSPPHTCRSSSLWICPQILTHGRQKNRMSRNTLWCRYFAFEIFEISGKQGENVYQILTSPLLSELEKQTF